MTRRADRVFLDANVLFSVAYRPESRLGSLWSLTGVKLLTSSLALGEARRNLYVHRPEGVERLDELARGMTVVDRPVCAIPAGLGLAEKDVHVLAAALQARCTHLITGDHRHFGELFGRVVEGVKIITPSQYLADRLAEE